MTTIQEQAVNYAKRETLTIDQLPKISVKLVLKEKIVHGGTPKEFRYKYVEENGQEYRVPISVISQLKQQLDANPNIQFFKVSKHGEGKTGTTYTVIPLLQ